MSDALTGREVLAIDAGTQGISVILWSYERKALLGLGESKYEHAYIPGLSGGRLEQYAHYWSDALAAAMKLLRNDVRARTGGAIATVSGIGVTGHMHCLVRMKKDGNKPFGCDMWNDPRGVPESRELAQLFAEHIPGRWTASHILAGMRADPDTWKQVAGVNVTSGSIVHDLTGEWVIGPGDASGMFGVLDASGQFDGAKLSALDQAAGNRFTPLSKMVPSVVPAGHVAGRLDEKGSALLGGLPVGIPVAAPEGDQQSVLVGAAAGEMELALSAGTSFTGNLSCRAHIKAESEAFNVLHTPDLMTMLMVCARNGTIGFARFVDGHAKLSGRGFGDMADILTDHAAHVPADAYGTMLMPFFQGENVAELPEARASLFNAGLELVSDPGLMARLLLEAPCMTMRYGIERLPAEAGRMRRVILTGGAAKSKGGFAPQLFADILGVPVISRPGDEEGTAKGAAFLAAYMVKMQSGEKAVSLSDFAATQLTGSEQRWVPDEGRSRILNQRYQTFAKQITAAQRH